MLKIEREECCGQDSESGRHEGVGGCGRSGDKKKTSNRNSKRKVMKIEFVFPRLTRSMWLRSIAMVDKSCLKNKCLNLKVEWR